MSKRKEEANDDEKKERRTFDEEAWNAKIFIAQKKKKDFDQRIEDEKL